MNNKCIMIVDDEIPITDLLTSCVSRMGYNSLVFDNGLEAITEYERVSSDIVMVVTDITMPGLYGLNLVDKILSINPTIPILIVTGLVVGDISGLKILMKNKNVDILAKPFGISEFREKISSMIDQNKYKSNKEYYDL